MLCDICHKNSATLHLTEIVNDKVREMHICQNCAKLKAEEIKDQYGVSDFLGGLVEGFDETKEKITLHCPNCGLTYQEFRKNGRLGCAECYKTFRLSLITLLKKIHGSSQHMGKIPSDSEAKILKPDKLKELKEKLEKAISLEYYEEAAQLRDEIRKLEVKIK